MGDTKAAELCSLPLPETRAATSCSISNSSSCISSSSNNAADDNNCYCKILVTNHLAGIIIGQAGHEIRALKTLTGAKIVLSPHGMYFPGTMERVAAVEGPEQAVFHVLDWVLDKMAVAAAAAAAAGAAVGGSVSVAGECPGGASALLSEEQQQQQQQQLLLQQQLSTVRICVPRAVVGSLIGKNGGYIQSLRVATGATINISPLFVTAEEACAERIVSVESRKRQNLKAAAFTLIKKINEHPDKGCCRHVCYFRKHSFESPLAEPLAAARSRLQQQQMQQQQHQMQQQQQMQQLQQHREQELRRRAVSLVMGTVSSSSMFDAAAANSGSSNSSNNLVPAAAEDSFAAAFKRFCEARATAKAAAKEAPAAAAAAAAATVAKARAAAASRISAAAAAAAAQGGAAIDAVPTLTRNMKEVIAQARAAKEAAATAEATATAAATAVAGKGPNETVWDFSACSTAAGSTDKLPTISEDGSIYNATIEEEETSSRARLQRQQQQPSLSLLILIAVFLAALLRIVFNN
ncbi:KH domain-containing protein, putative [Eimeria tenella]|uniref:KH domain-containing protein, putative n=1 Tax=Eimeria tenella TaxID=5802 RepID=U6KXJ2_EIMTE|nr:KH domain-containing protein, putative [Eimeria tenella]CDJ42686.1 KH domain-containing protein, putative [Eimeria tenella]|eukprot:XP_013233436.1 KH domain-containing protein, putative [Eimeria tenella]